MYLQLGNKKYDKVETPNDFGKTDEASYAEHALINGKPTLQPTGNNLEEIEFTISLRGENVSITETVIALKKSKDQFEVLPLVMGNGRYLGDYVIISIKEDTISSFPDGSPIEVLLTISLKEFQVADKLQQQQNEARKNAYAVGNKVAVRIISPQPDTPEQAAVKSLSKVKSHGIVIDRLVSSYENATSLQQNISDKIQASLGQVDKYLTQATGYVNQVTSLADPSGLLASIASVQNILSNFSFPITSVSDLKLNNTQLQSLIRGMNTASTSLLNKVITREA